MPRRIASESRPKQKTGRRKLIEFDEETWVALDLLVRNRLSSIQELADEDHRPVGLRAALRESAKAKTRRKQRGCLRAAFRAALEQYPNSRIRPRNRALVMEEYKPKMKDPRRPSQGYAEAL
jgi:hypothetical protein